MRVTAYVAVLASLLAALLAFAATPVVAQVMPDQPMDQPGTAGVEKGKMSGEAEKTFTGEAKTGTTPGEKARGEMKPPMKSEEKVGVSPEPKARMSGEVEGKAKAEVEKQKVEGEMKARMKGEAEKEVGKKPEARGFEERRPGMTERGDVGFKKEGAMRTEAPSQAKGGEALVVRVDRPENCLRIRGGPSSSSDVIACAAERETLILTGAFSQDGQWAQLDKGGWVFIDQIQTDVRPAEAMASGRGWEERAAAGAGKKSPKRAPHYYGGSCYFTPGYYWYPGYYY